MKFVVKYFTFAMTAALCAAPALAEQTLELTLQPTSEQPTSKFSRKDAQLSARGMTSRSQIIERNTASSMGRVGFVESDKCSIRNSRSSRGRVLFSVKKGTPLAVINTVGQWYGVLMVDGSTGWVPVSDMRISDLRIVTDSTVSAPVSGSLLEHAMTYVGTPYVWGGNSRSGIDCSGFVQQVFRSFGRSLPRTAREQALVGELVPFDQIAPGDRLYFSCKGAYVDHAGIYMGNGMFIHSSAGRGGVAVEQLGGAKYSSALVVVRRG